MTPKVTVLLPVYNCEHYLSDCLDSVLNQSYQNLEVIIINDCSTDGSLEVIRKYVDDQRVVLINNILNLGIAKSLNKGLDVANGEYIARMDSDDICEPSRIEEQVRFLEEHQNIAVCGGFVRTFGLKSTLDKYPITPSEIRINLMFGCCMPHPLVMFRREIADKFRYSTSTKVEDFDLWIDLASAGYNFYNLPRVLLHYRVRETSLSHIEGDENKSKDLIEDYVRALQRANKLVAGFEISRQEIDTLFLNASMTFKGYSLAETAVTFRKYYKLCKQSMSPCDLKILRRSLSQHFYAKCVLLAQRREFTVPTYITMPFNCYRFRVKNLIVLLYFYLRGMLNGMS